MQRIQSETQRTQIKRQIHGRGNDTESFSIAGTLTAVCRIALLSVKLQKITANLLLLCHWFMQRQNYYFCIKTNLMHTCINTYF